jgi:valyl-tRNA synthetase
VAELKKKKLLEKIESYKVPLGLCYRCNTIIEPYLSEQWFVKMKPLAEPAIQVVKNGKVKFYPEHWSKVYLNWMENIRDWCISRQLWWGHRIPVWYCLDCQEVIVDKTPPVECSRCKSRNLKQEEDVLDTWFSSWLWPFSTFGWPEKTEELKSFYPTRALFTASEIIFLWVARMVMAGLEFMGEVPFYDVYIHGTVRDANGVKMSKSLGNGIDPLEIIKEYGADALRLSTILVTPEGQDPCISFNTFEIGRNFANKLWNAFRFIWINTKDQKPKIGKMSTPEKSNLRWEDRWILSRLNQTVNEVTRQMESYRFNSATKILYDFVWHDFCDWYLEMIKVIFRLSEKETEKVNSKKTALFLLDNILRLLHPFIPFVTEEIWQNLYSLSPDDFRNSLIKASWPKPDPVLVDSELERTMDLVQEVVTSVRNIRSEMNIPPAKKLTAYLKVEKKETQKLLDENREHILTLGRIEKLELGLKTKKPSLSASAVAKDFEVYIPLEGLIDVEQERVKLENEITRLKELLVGVDRKLANEDFLKKAPPSIVQKEKAKKEDYQKLIEKLEKNLEGLVGW